eukprot:4587319-Alexandrium_andersonii.AAC.1
MESVWQSLCAALRKKANAIELVDSQAAVAPSVVGRAKAATGPVTPTKAPHAVGRSGPVVSLPSAKVTDAAQGAVPAEPAAAASWWRRRIGCGRGH